MEPASSSSKVIGDVVKRLADDLCDLRRRVRTFVQNDEGMDPDVMTQAVLDDFLDALSALTGSLRLRLHCASSSVESPSLLSSRRA